MKVDPTRMATKNYEDGGLHLAVPMETEADDPLFKRSPLTGKASPLGRQATGETSEQGERR